MAVTPSPITPIATLLSLFTQLSGVQVVEAPAKRPHLGQGPGQEHAWIVVNIPDYSALGVDEQRAQFDPVNNVNTFLLRGDRQLLTTLTGYSLDPTIPARDLLERIRFRLHTDFAVSIFKQAHLAIASSGRDMKIRPSHEKADDKTGQATRLIRTAIMEIRWNTVSAAVLSPTDQDGNWIQTVNGGNPVGIIPGGAGIGGL